VNLPEEEGVQRNSEIEGELMAVFLISLTLWVSNRDDMRGIFQVLFGLIRSERTRLVELGGPGKRGTGMKEGIDGIHGAFQMGMGE
jgi:hypothetical protein